MLLKSAIAAVDASGAKDDLREEAFKAAIALLAGGTPAAAGAPAVTPAPPIVSGTGPAAPKPAVPGDTGDPLDAVAAYLNCGTADVHRIFAVQDGVPELKVPTKMLPLKKGTATPDLALLAMAARQGAAIEEYTEGKSIREAVKVYSKFDQSNHSQYMRNLDHLVLKKGSGATVERKLTRPGIEAAAAKVAEYAAAVVA